MNKLQELLEGLGSTVQEVFSNLKKKGIKGARNCAHSCVLANYLTRELGEVVGVDGFEASTYDGYYSKERARLPESVRLLVRYFDKGMYPELEEGYAGEGHAAGKNDVPVPGESEP